MLKIVADAVLTKSQKSKNNALYTDTLNLQHSGTTMKKPSDSKFTLAGFLACLKMEDCVYFMLEMNSTSISRSNSKNKDSIMMKNVQI